MVAEIGSPVQVCVETPSYPGNAPDEITLSLTVTDNDASECSTGSTDSILTLCLIE